MPGDNGSSEVEKKKITRIAVGERFLVLMNLGRVFFCAFGTTISYVKVMYQSNRSFNIPPPRGIPRAFDASSWPGGREFDHS